MTVGGAEISWWFAPLFVFAALGVLAGFSRWAFTPAKRAPRQPPRFGMLETLAEYGSASEAEVMAHRLRVQGIRASTGTHQRKHYLLVWPAQSALGKAALARMPGPGAPG